ncbi:MAG TPA: hypothetical protein VMT67_06430 [Terriglobales bacterium]|nr:hypothetical protein [Terriglobales bacterium]
MQTIGCSIISRIARRIAVGAVLWMWASSTMHPQDASYPPHKPSPPTIEQQIVLLAGSVVETQWTHTLNLVNASQNTKLLNPGGCIRVGIYSTGDNRDQYLEKTKLSFRVRFAGHDETHPLASLSQFKQIKPEGGDFVAGALAAAGVKQPESTKTMASFGVSADQWCAPTDAGDGVATVEAEVESPGGHQVLTSASLQIESFETGSKKAFKDGRELGQFAQTYYRQPNPARLLPALQFLVEDQTKQSRQGQVEIVTAFLSAALNSDPTAARDFQMRLATREPLTRALGLLTLRSAGYDVSGSLKALSAAEQEKFNSLPQLQDPFDLTPTQDLFQHLDMMWMVFGATGQFKPVQTIASTLAWRSDYEEFDKMRKSKIHPTSLTPSIVRGVTYTAAGWSLRSFQRNDPLAADYVDYLLTSSDTPEPVKAELRGLWRNPAFQQAGGGEKSQ